VTSLINKAHFAAVFIAIILAVCSCGGVLPATARLSDTSDRDSNSGGDTTTSLVTREAFTQPTANITDADRRAFMIGQSVFNQNWVAAPSNNRDHQGLGPLFNAQSCSSCHVKAGRGLPPNADHPERLGLLFRLSVPGVNGHGGPLPEPCYGQQLHPFAIMGIPPDGAVEIQYLEKHLDLPGGGSLALRAPTYRFRDLAYGQLCPGTLVSPRVALPLFGLGLLEDIPVSALMAHAQRSVGDPDGIHGHLNRVWDIRRQAMAIGRFGWKANQPTIEQQVASAFQGDIGITSSLYPEENTPASHRLASGRPSGGEAGAPELSELKLQRLTTWTHLLAVPARRDVDDPSVQRGQQLFQVFRCDACHVPTWTTGPDDAFPELAHQTIHPYSDLLLHDLGSALADGRPDFGAGPREWRTPPLWGIGLTATVSAQQSYLHDGRARSLLEAVAWHGGEAASSRDRLLQASQEDRQALLRFLASL
jgi:CxxC motif-containing protein (DUF1111 family)